MQYRRSNIKGATYFFMVNLAERNSFLLIDEFDQLRSIINSVKKDHPFILDGKPIQRAIVSNISLVEYQLARRLG